MENKNNLLDPQKFYEDLFTTALDRDSIFGDSYESLMLLDVYNIKNFNDYKTYLYNNRNMLYIVFGNITNMFHKLLMSEIKKNLDEFYKIVLEIYVAKLIDPIKFKEKEKLIIESTAKAVNLTNKYFEKNKNRTYTFTQIFGEYFDNLVFNKQFKVVT